MRVAAVAYGVLLIITHAHILPIPLYTTFTVTTLSTSIALNAFAGRVLIPC